MNKQEKLLKLIEIAKHGDESYQTRPSTYIRLTNLYRLADGDLSHIGDAIINRLCVLMDGDHYKEPSFECYVKHYTIARPTIMIGDIECVRGETVEPEGGARCFTFSVDNVFDLTWYGDAPDKKRLDSGRVWLTYKDAEQALNAIKKLLKGE